MHNLLDWEAHLETLADWKAEGRVRYVGVTTSHGRRHPDMVRVLANEPLDFVQFTYNILDREAERVLLPLAAERGLAVIVNRPFRRGRLFDLFQRHPLPDWAAEIDCANWAQFLLKFAVSHPAVTCAIPATSRVDHMEEIWVLPMPPAGPPRCGGGWCGTWKCCKRFPTRNGEVPAGQFARCFRDTNGFGLARPRRSMLT